MQTAAVLPRRAQRLRAWFWCSSFVGQSRRAWSANNNAYVARIHIVLLKHPVHLPPRNGYPNTHLAEPCFFQTHVLGGSPFCCKWSRVTPHIRKETRGAIRRDGLSEGLAVEKVWRGKRFNFACLAGAHATSRMSQVGRHHLMISRSRGGLGVENGRCGPYKSGPTGYSALLRVWQGSERYGGQ